MELIIINEKELKIVLNCAEAREYGIDTRDGENVGGDGVKAILKNASRKCGMDLCAGRVFIRHCQSDTGGCELLVAKLTQDSENGGEANFDKPQKHVAPAPPSRSDAQREMKTGSCFCFDEMGHMISACRALAARGDLACLSGSAFRCDDEKFRLFLPHVEEGETLPAELAVLEEYGVRESRVFADAYAAEHGYAICDGDAVATLARC